MYFYIEDLKGNKIKKHWLLDLLSSPNYFQSTQDFLLNISFFKIANGAAAIYKKGPIGYNTTDLFVLNTDLIE